MLASQRLGRRGSMTKKKVVRKTARKAAGRLKKATARSRRTPAPARTPAARPLLARLRGAERREIGHVVLEVGRAGSARVKRMIYPPGFRWSVDMKPVV